MYFSSYPKNSLTLSFDRHFKLEKNSFFLNHQRNQIHNYKYRNKRKYSKYTKKY